MTEAKGNTLPPHPYICGSCQHYTGMKVVEVEDGLEGDPVHYCSAFPKKIPEKILKGEHCIRFEQKGGE
jgi:hypothetical protein